MRNPRPPRVGETGFERIVNVVGNQAKMLRSLQIADVTASCPIPPASPAVSALPPSTPPAWSRRGADLPSAVARADWASSRVRRGAERCASQPRPASRLVRIPLVGRAAERRLRRTFLAASSPKSRSPVRTRRWRRPWPVRRVRRVFGRPVPARRLPASRRELAGHGSSPSTAMATPYTSRPTPVRPALGATPPRPGSPRSRSRAACATPSPIRRTCPGLWLPRQASNRPAGDRLPAGEVDSASTNT